MDGQAEEDTTMVKRRHRPDTWHGAYTHDSGQRTPPRSAPLQAEHRAGGRVHTPARVVVPPVGRHQLPQGSSTYMTMVMRVVNKPESSLEFGSPAIARRRQEEPAGANQ
jgi:hypothetical protein